MSRLGRAGRIALALVFLSSMTLSPTVWAGAYIFAGESYGVDLILHPTGYTGSGGVLNVGVCIDPNSLNAQDLVIPIKNNISVWNDLQPIANNVQTGVVSGIDAESVLLHEMGHCIGLAHVNAASESGLGENNITKATDGANNVFDVNKGPDNIAGSYDDIRGDDVNLHWFNPANDPFQLPIHTPVDTTQYKRETGFLPAGDSFAQNASRALAPAMGYPSSEAVMQQGTYGGETQRELMSDGASTIMLAASGVDESAGTGDDYQIVLTYEGITNTGNCDITVIMEEMSGLAYCSVGGGSIASNHWRISSASIHLGAGYTYHFNTELRDSGGNQPPVAGDDSGSVAEDGAVDIAVLSNDSDPDEDPLDVAGVSNPPHGTASVNGDDTINYAPDANYNGSDNFSYTLSDGNGGTDTGSVSVTVNPVNDSPVATDDSGITTNQDSPVNIDVLFNDNDVDNDPLSVSGVTNGTFGAVTNNSSDVTYTPNVGYSGPDSFSYTASDGNGGTDTANVSLNVLAANLPPIASFTFDCNGQTCDFDASGSFDSDGSIASHTWDFGDGNNGSGVQPNHSYATAGTRTVTLTVTDNRSDTGVSSASVTTTPDPVAPDYAVADFNTVQGTLSGSYQATWAADGTEQSVTETHSGGRPSRRTDSLEHIWQFDLAEGNSTFNVVADGEFGNGDADLAFHFEWSTNPNSGWQHMVTVPGGPNTFDIDSGVSGIIYVHVIDNDGDAQGNTTYSTINVDQMFFDGAMPPTEPPAQASSPSPNDGATGVSVNTTLSWMAGAGTDTHDVYFGTTSGSLALVSNDQTGTSYTPSADLDPTTTYYWRVDETNAIGTTTSVEWSFMTNSNAGPTKLQVGSIVLSTVNAGKGKKDGRAVVTVVDDLGNPISGVTVEGAFSDSFTESVSGDTSGAAVTFTTTGEPVKRPTFTFCVNDITGELPYNDGQVCQSY
jgi:hypothetical protein